MGHTLLGYAQFLCALGDFALTANEKRNVAMLRRGDVDCANLDGFDADPPRS